MLTWGFGHVSWWSRDAVVEGADVGGGRASVAGAGVAGSLDAVAVVAGSFDDAGVAALAPFRVGLAGDLGQDVGQDAVPVLRGETRRTGGGTAGDAQDPDEGDPVGVQVRGLGGAGGQGADRVVDQQPCPDLLVDQVGQLRAKDLARPAQVGLELVVAGLFLSGSPGAFPLKNNL